MVERPRIKFFIDNFVPDSVGRVLRRAGHEVILQRDVIARDAADPVVARMSEVFDAVLVSFDRDFQSLAPRMGIGQRRVRKLSRIALRCREPQAAQRVELAVSLIDHEWQAAQAASDKRMIVAISETTITTVR